MKDICKERRRGSPNRWFSLQVWADPKPGAQSFSGSPYMYMERETERKLDLLAHPLMLTTRAGSAGNKEFEMPCVFTMEVVGTPILALSPATSMGYALSGSWIRCGGET